MKTYQLPGPKSYEDANNSFMAAMGDPRRMCRYMGLALIGITAIAGGLLALNFRTASQQREKIVVRIDDVGRAQAVGFTSAGKVQPNETKYFLAQFVHDYYGRNRMTLRDDFARSMMFLNASLASARMEDERRGKSIEHFMIGSDDEIEVQVTNIILSDMSHQPFKAQVDIEKIYRDRTGAESKREKYVDSISFGVSSEVPNSAILTNPLGFVVLNIREDQAFK